MFTIGFKPSNPGKKKTPFDIPFDTDELKAI